MPVPSPWCERYLHRRHRGWYFILRIHWVGHCSLSEIEAEVELLIALNDAGISVFHPVRQQLSFIASHNLITSVKTNRHP